MSRKRTCRIWELFFRPWSSSSGSGHAPAFLLSRNMLCWVDIHNSFGLLILQSYAHYYNPFLYDQLWTNLFRISLLCALVTEFVAHLSPDDGQENLASAKSTLILVVVGSCLVHFSEVWNGVIMFIASVSTRTDPSCSSIGWRSRHTNII